MWNWPVPRCSVTALTPYPKPILQLWINSQRCSQPPQTAFPPIHWQITPKSARNYHCGWLQQSYTANKACDWSKAIESACASYQVHWQCFISVFVFPELEHCDHNWIFSYLKNCLTSIIGAVQEEGYRAITGIKKYNCWLQQNLGKSPFLIWHTAFLLEVCTSDCRYWVTEDIGGI